MPDIVLCECPPAQLQQLGEHFSGAAPAAKPRRLESCDTRDSCLARRGPAPDFGFRSALAADLSHRVISPVWTGWSFGGEAADRLPLLPSGPCPASEAPHSRS